MSAAVYPGADSADLGVDVEAGGGRTFIQGLRPAAMVGVKAVVQGGNYAATVLVVALVQNLLQVVLRM